MSTQQEVDLSYGVSNEFFRLWLDRRMSYTCALYEDTVHYSDDFDAAQDNKLRRLSRFAGTRDAGVESVLDIGCGWGANLEYQSVVNSVPEVHGITLCREQYEHCLRRELKGVTVSCIDYRDYQPPRRFHAIQCICMMEHIARPEDARSGRHLDLYRDFFRRAHSWSLPESSFALQVITRCGVPRERADLADLRHANEVIFPGGMTPRVEDIFVAANPYYEVAEMHALRPHYQHTCMAWRSRLRRHRDQIIERWGAGLFADYDRYLSTCIRAFERNWQSLHQFHLRRLAL